MIFGNQFVERGCCQRWCALCILMMGMGDKTLEQIQSSLAINRNADNLRIQRET